MTVSRRLLFAASGTGGHVFPGLAVARAAAALGDIHIRFVGTARGMESRFVPAAGFELTRVEVPPLRGRSAIVLLRSSPGLIAGMVGMFRLIRQFRPHAIFGTGGAVSGAAVLSGWLAGVPSLLLEPNAEPGLATRWSARFATAIAVAWESSRQHFGGRSVFVSGIPVRPEFLGISAPPGRDCEVGVLITGGSQGASRLNRCVREALPFLADAMPRLRITHQTGAAEADSVREAYRRHGLAARVVPFLDDMAGALSGADLVVGRSGAITCAELAVTGRPAILVPAPVAGAHQRRNAEAFESAGAAMVLPDGVSGEEFARVLLALAADPGRRRGMSASALRLARDRPAETLADQLVALNAA